MRIASLPIIILMQKRAPVHRWAGASWSVAGVVPDPQQEAGPGIRIEPLIRTAAQELYRVRGLELDLYPDENDGYFENWAAPAPKVFVRWRMQGGLPMPVLASVSYGEGTRMFDSGDPADGAPMPPEIHAWLAHYLRDHYQPPEGGKRGRA